MMSETNDKILQVGCNPTIGSDRVKVPVASAGPTDSGGDQQSSNLDSAITSSLCMSALKGKASLANICTKIGHLPVINQNNSQLENEKENIAESWNPDSGLASVLPISKKATQTRTLTHGSILSKVNLSDTGIAEKAPVVFEIYIKSNVDSKSSSSKKHTELLKQIKRILTKAVIYPCNRILFYLLWTQQLLLQIIKKVTLFLEGVCQIIIYLCNRVLLYLLQKLILFPYLHQNPNARSGNLTNRTKKTS